MLNQQLVPQVEVTTAMMILDAYRALEKLSKHPNIDKERVSITGWSLGGAVSYFRDGFQLKCNYKRCIFRISSSHISTLFCRSKKYRFYRRSNSYFNREIDN